MGKIIIGLHYLNDKGLNGKRKEYYDNYDNYDNCRIIFKGKCLNGERHGKGKEIFYNGNLLFYGEYLNGKRWNGKGYNNKGNIEFEIINGNGKVKEYYYNGEMP